MRRGYFADAVLNLFFLLWQGIVLLFTTLWGWGFVVILSSLGALFVSKRRRMRKKSALTEERRALREKWMRFEKRFSRRTGVKRPGEIPLREFYGSFGSLPGLREVVEKYEKMRFGPPEQLPDASLLADWEKNVEKLLLFLEKEGAKIAKRE